MTKTRIVSLGGAAERPYPVGEVAAALLEDAVAAYPTETLYALGAAALSKKALEKVYRLKKRERGKPLPLVASDLDMVREIAAALPPAFGPLAAEFWPGPLTLVLPAAKGLPEFLTGPGRTVAIRIPPLAWLRALVREVSQPLTATSANLSGEKGLCDPGDVIALFRGRIDIIVDGGPAPGGPPSTIVDLSFPEPRVLREGTIAAERVLVALRS